MHTLKLFDSMTYASSLQIPKTEPNVENMFSWTIKMVWYEGCGTIWCQQ